MLVAEGADLAQVRGDQGRRNEFGEFGDEEFFRRVAHLLRIVDHQGLGMDALQDMGRGDIGHVEGRVLAHQHHIRRRQVIDKGLAQREMIALDRAHIQRPHMAR